MKSGGGGHVDILNGDLMCGGISELYYKCFSYYLFRLLIKRSQRLVDPYKFYFCVLFQ